MNLPVVLDIAIGLIFIYLIASLLASELQELLSTLLQWRAKHLREAVQNLLAGGQGTQETDQLRGFVENVYSDPLLKNINQGSKGLIGSVGHWLYHNVFYRTSVFGDRQTTAPSYIPSETFATALLEQLGMPLLIDKLTEIRLEKFATRIVGLYTVENGKVTVPPDEFFGDKDNWEKGSIRVLTEKAKSLGQETALPDSSTTVMLMLNQDEDFIALAEDYNDLLKDFEAKEADLDTCVERMSEGLGNYINQVGARVSAIEAQAKSGDETAAASQLEQKRLTYFKKRLESFKQSVFGETNERAVVSGKLKPNLLEIAEFFDRASSTYQEMATAYRDVASAYEVGLMPERVQPLLDQVATKVSEIYSASASVAQDSPAQDTPAQDPPAQDPAAQDPPAQDPPAQSLSMQSLSMQSAAVQGEPAQDATFVTAVQPEAVSAAFEPSAPLSLTLTRSDLFKAEYKPYVQDVLKSLPADQLALYKGWQIYQQVIFRVTSLIAQQLQTRGRLFDGDRELDSLGNLTPLELNQCVESSLRLLSNEERQLTVNSAVNELPNEQRKIYRNYRTYLEAQDMLARVPDSVKQSLAILARRAQTKVTETERQLGQFRTEVSVWFDRSMSRASGVYKRNAKGVAILIGFTIAIVSNADTFHIVARLSNDDDLRAVITQRANEFVQTSPKERIFNRDQLRQLKRETDAVLQEIDFPIRWTPDSLRQQFGCKDTSQSGDKSVDLTSWNSFYQACLPNQAVAPVDESFNLLKVGQIAIVHWVDLLRVIAGWFLSGIAISMGAPFWFDLLGKVMNVRNTGAKPATADHKEVAK
jgi:hypothetical protein